MARLDYPGRLGIFSALAMMAVGVSPAQTGLDTLEGRARTSKLRLETVPARWVVRATLQTGARFGIRVISAPPDFEVRIVVKPDADKPEPFARVVARAGKWAVEEIGGLKGIYQPWEAPFSYEIVAQLLSEAWPPCYARGAEHTLSKRIGDTIVVRSPLSPSQKMKAESFLRKSSGVPAEPGSELAQNLREIRRRLSEGNQLRVNESTGFMERNTVGPLDLEYSGVEWLEESPEIPLIKSYPDYSAPLPADRDGIVMIGRSGSWRPGYPEMEPGGQLLNIDTGKIIRIPFAGGSCIPGCFTDQRTKVVVSANAKDGSGVELFLVDLLQGTQMSLGGDTLSGGLCRSPALSPDGQTLALVYSKEPGRDQVYLLSSNEGDPQPLGGPMDIRNLSWMGDGMGLVLLVGEAGQRREESSGMRIVRLGLAGAMSGIRSDTGAFATVAGKNSQRILFLGSDQLWYTCGLNGKGVSRVGNGLKGLADPAVNPEGTHAVMIERDAEGHTWPIIVDLVSGKRFPIEVEPGRWLNPVWR
ncbi:MAG: hypothetical protein CMN02_13240 [Roseibacillus sp.]|nr:hypothetical protein [Roseibacillus sp.]